MTALADTERFKLCAITFNRSFLKALQAVLIREKIASLGAVWNYIRSFAGDDSVTAAWANFIDTCKATTPPAAPPDRLPSYLEFSEFDEATKLLRCFITNFITQSRHLIDFDAGAGVTTLPMPDICMDRGPLNAESDRLKSSDYVERKLTYLTGYAVNAAQKRVNRSKSLPLRKEMLQLTDNLGTDNTANALEFGLKHRFDPKPEFLPFSKLLYERVTLLVNEKSMTLYGCRLLQEIMQQLKADAEIRETLVNVLQACAAPHELVQLVADSYLALYLLSFMHHKFKHCLMELNCTPTGRTVQSLRADLLAYENAKHTTTKNM